ncbi:MAG: multidrug resistance protein family [Proteobacteria bacterium]|nr:multidrug resistance protein family [Pseudomonadota bacterium]
MRSRARLVKPSPMSRFPLFLAESKALSSLSIPIILSQLAYSLLGVIDTLMSGHAGATEQAAVALGVAFWFPIFLTLMSVVQALSPMVAHHHGAGDNRAIVHDTQNAIWLALVLSVLSLALLPLVRPILHWAQITPALADKTMLFLWGAMFGMPAALLFRALAFYSASINRPKPMMYLAFAALGFNALFNWLLIWGHWGLPALGGAGCGWASAIGMWISLAAMAVWTIVSPDYRACYIWRDWQRPQWLTQRSLLRIGLPMGGAALAEVGAFTSVAVFIGRFGAEQIAAHQIALNVASLLFMLPMGLAASTTIRVSQHLGSGEPRRARFAAWTSILLGLIIACLAIPAILLGRDAIVAGFSTDEGVRGIASRLILFAALWQLVDATQVIAVGALRGYKMTLWPMLVMFVAFWGVGLPLGTVLGYYGVAGSGPLGVYGFWSGLVTGLFLAAIGLTFGLRKVAWGHVRGG